MDYSCLGYTGASIRMDERRAMKAGDLVMCKFQPKSSGYNRDTGTVMPMVHQIKGALGIYVEHAHFENAGVVLFPQFGYEHTVAWSALEVMTKACGSDQ